MTNDKLISVKHLMLSAMRSTAQVDEKISELADAVSKELEELHSAKQDRLDVPSWAESTFPSNSAWHSVAYGNGMYVAIANESSKTAYSTDGITWTETTNLPSESDWRSIVYGDGKFVAISYGTAGAYSTDGINWTPITFPVSRNRNSVTYGNGMFVAVCYSSNAVSYSTDGINWSESTLPSSGSWYSVTYGNGTFVAIANESDMAAYSIDGVNWTETTLPSNTRWYHVAYGNGMFVAVSYNTAVAAYSTDGINWTETTLPSATYWRSVAYGNGMFMAVAYNSTNSAYSTDGINWVAAELPCKTYWYSVAYGTAGFVAVGFSSDKVAYAKTTELFAARVDAEVIKTLLTPDNIGLSTETWTFTLEDGRTVVKEVFVGATYIEEAPITLISFSIHNVPYEAEEGMTWAQWCNSEYNTDGYSEEMFGRIDDGGGRYVCYRQGLGTGETVGADEEITPDYDYCLG